MKKISKLIEELKKGGSVSGKIEVKKSIDDYVVDYYGMQKGFPRPMRPGAKVRRPPKDPVQARQEKQQRKEAKEI